MPVGWDHNGAPARESRSIVRGWADGHLSKENGGACVADSAGLLSGITLLSTSSRRLLAASAWPSLQSSPYLWRRIPA